jgi:hypothetical protein
MNGRQSSVSGIFELKIDNPSSKDLTGTANTSSPQRVRPVADADERETRLDAAFRARSLQVFSILFSKEGAANVSDIRDQRQAVSSSRTAVLAPSAFL